MNEVGSFTAHDQWAMTKPTRSAGTTKRTMGGLDMSTNDIVDPLAKVQQVVTLYSASIHCLTTSLGYDFYVQPHLSLLIVARDSESDEKTAIKYIPCTPALLQLELLKQGRRLAYITLFSDTFSFPTFFGQN